MNNISEIEQKRTGGQISLMGYSYQLLYSMYLTLKYVKGDSYAKFEGIEDIDTYKVEQYENNNTIYHTQLKYSTNQQDASFLKSVLKNFLEIYLLDKSNENRYFKLVYNFKIAQGNLHKLTNNKLDQKSKKYWHEVISLIQQECPNWNWEGFNFDNFIKQLKFEQLQKEEIEVEIGKLITDKFDIYTNNINLFLNGIFYYIFQLAKNRGSINYNELIKIIQNIKDDIARGEINPAVNWIEKITFEKVSEKYISPYYEGKKVTQKDIINQIPIRRTTLENKIENAISRNTITVLKASSGQGKSTLAYQVAHNLQNRFSIYKIEWCKEAKELNHILHFFKSRISIGENLLILIDNLNEEQKEWNKLAQLLHEDISINYKILITTREEDWHKYAGDQSYLGVLEIIKPELNIDEAKKIYHQLRVQDKTHKNISNWQIAWEKVQDNRLLIEYVYLITHGQMLKDKISNQIRQISNSENHYVKLKILRIISLADIMGIKIKTKNLTSFLNKEQYNTDLNLVLKSLEDEYYYKFQNDFEYLEGLHAVRSQHLVDILFENISFEVTIEHLLEIIDNFYISKLCSNIPLYISEENKEEFYEEFSKRIINKPYKFLINIFKGLFSGDSLNYYLSNKIVINRANEKGHLFLLITEIFPLKNNLINNSQTNFLEELKKYKHFTKGIQDFELELKLIPKLDIKKSDTYIFAYYLYNNLVNTPLKRVLDGFADLANWLFRIDSNFNITTLLDPDQLWSYRENLIFEDLSLLFYLISKTNPIKYRHFVSTNKSCIFTFLKISTNSVVLSEVENNRLSIKYILLPSDTKYANKYSMDRIEKISRFLPLFDKYTIEAIQPSIDVLNQYKRFDESKRNISFDRIELGFNTDITSLWKKTIYSQFEADSIYNWQNYWISLRKEILKLLKINLNLIIKRINNQKIKESEVTQFIETKNNVISISLKTYLFPNESSPFRKNEIKEAKYLKKYLHDFTTYLNTAIDVLISKDQTNLTLYNLKTTILSLDKMHNEYNIIYTSTVNYFSTDTLCLEEIQYFNKLINYLEFYLKYNGKIINFSKYDINRWHLNNKNKLITSLTHSIENINTQFNINFSIPNDIYKEELFNILPISIELIELNNLSLEDLILSLDKFSILEIDFIIIVLTDSNKKVLPNSLKVSIQSIKSIINGDLIDFNPFIPIPTNLDILPLLNLNSINLLNEHNLEDDLLTSILFKLWEYSYLSNLENLLEEEVSHNNKLLKEIRLEINNLSSSILPSDQQYFRITKIIESVFNATLILDDTYLNTFINTLIQENLKKMYSPSSSN